MPFWPVMTGDKAAAGIDGAISKPEGYIYSVHAASR